MLLALLQVEGGDALASTQERLKAIEAELEQEQAAKQQQPKKKKKKKGKKRSKAQADVKDEL